MAERGPYRTGIERRRLVVDAALTVFGHVGFHGASVRDIADRAGMSHTSVLRLFGTKEALLKAVLEERDRRSRRDYDLDTSPPLEMLSHLVELARHNAEDRGLIELYSVLAAEAVSASHPAHDYFVMRYAEVRARLTQVFTDLDRDGILRSGVDPAGAARDVLAQSDGLQLQWLLAPDEIDLPGETRRLLESLITVPLEPRSH